MTQRIPADRVRHALRSLRPAVYEIEAGAEGTTLALVMSASPAGRRNAAEKIVDLLNTAGLRLVADDPVSELTEQRRGFIVVSAEP